MKSRIKFEKTEQNKLYYKIAKKITNLTVRNLSAENAVLCEPFHRKNYLTENQFQELIQSRYPDSLKVFGEHLLKNARLEHYDVQTGSKLLYCYLLESWLDPDKNEIGERELILYRKEFYDKYFSKIANVVPDENAKEFLPNFNVIDPFEIKKQRQVLRGIVAGYIKRGDNLLYYLCPLIPLLEYKISTENCTPFFKRLVERNGDNIFLKTSDPYSSDFIMAFAESFHFQLTEHRREFLLRLATLLLREGRILKR